MNYKAVWCAALCLALLPWQVLGQESNLYYQNLIQNPGFEADAERDGFPDYWQRKTDPPIKAALDSEDTVPPEVFGPHSRWRMDTQTFFEGKTALHVQMKGTSVAVEQNPEKDILVNINSAYKLEGYIRTRNIEHRSSKAYLELVWYNEKNEEVAAHPTEEITVNTNGWTKVQRVVNDLKPEYAKVRVRCLLMTSKRELDAPNFIGEAWFDQLKLFQQPQINLTTRMPANLFQEGLQATHVTFSAKGLLPGRYKLGLTVKDHTGVTVQEKPYHITPDSNGERSIPMVLQLPRKGYYAVRVMLYQDNREVLGSDIEVGLIGRGLLFPVQPGQLLYVHDQATLDPGAKADRDVLGRRTDYLQYLGVNLVKLDLWTAQTDLNDPKSYAFLDRYVNFINSQRMQVWGVLRDEPGKKIGQGQITNMFKLLSGPGSVWTPWFLTTMEKFGTRVVGFQLGGAADASFQSAPDEDRKRMLTKLEGIHNNRLRQALPIPNELSVRPGGYGDNHAKLDYVFSFKDEQSIVTQPIEIENVRTHVHLPLLPMTAGEDQRAALIRFARQVVLLKRAGYDRAYTELMHTQQGVYRENGAPSPLFFAFRVLNEIVESPIFLGQLQLESNAVNYVFASGGEIHMVAWMEEGEASEEIFLGVDTVEADLMGNRRKIGLNADGRNVLPLEKTPKFFLNLNREVMRTRLSFALETPELSARQVEIFQGIKFRNAFSAPLKGEMELLTGKAWKLQPHHFSFNLDVDQPYVGEFKMTPPKYENTFGKASAKRMLVKLKVDHGVPPQLDHMRVLIGYSFKSSQIALDLGAGQDINNTSSWIKMEDRDGKTYAVLTPRYRYDGRGRPFELQGFVSVPGHRERTYPYGVLESGGRAPNRPVEIRVALDDIKRGGVVFGAREVGGQSRFFNMVLTYKDNQVQLENQVQKVK